EIFGEANAHAGVIEGCRTVGEFLIDGGREARSRSKIRFAQHQLDAVFAHDGGGDLFFDERAADDLADSGVIFLDGRAARAATSRAETANGERALSDSINFSVSAEERSLQEEAALEGLGVAEGGDGHIEARAWFDEGGNVG